MNVDPALVRHVARLAGLRLDDDEVGRFAIELREILTHFETLSAWSRDREEPRVGYESGGAIEREDESEAPRSSEGATIGSPASERGHFRVPPAIEGR